MAFPTTPTNGQVYNDKKYNSTKGAWESMLNGGVVKLGMSSELDWNGNTFAMRSAESIGVLQLKGSISGNYAPRMEFYNGASTTVVASINGLGSGEASFGTITGNGVKTNTGSGTNVVPVEVMGVGLLAPDAYAIPGINFLNSWQSTHDAWMNFMVRDSNHNRITAMTIDSSGNIGIGTITPTSNGGLASAKIHLHSAATDWSVLHTTNMTSGAASGAGSIFGAIGGDAIIANYSSTGAITFGAGGGGERMRIAADGKVGIGLINATANLEVYNSSATANIYVRSGAGNGNLTLSRSATTNSSEIRFCTLPTKCDWILGDSTGQGAANDLTFFDYQASKNVITFQQNTGNVGIGVNSPSQPLHVNGVMQWGGSISAPYIYSGIDTNGAYIEHRGTTTTNDSLRIQSSPSGNQSTYSALVIDPTSPGTFNFNNGNVGIGDTADYKFVVKSASTVGVWLARFTNGNSEGLFIHHNGSDNAGFSGGSANTIILAADYVNSASYRNLGFGTSGIQRMMVDTGGNININNLSGTGNRAVYSDASGNLTNSASDRTLKTNIEDLIYSTAEVMKLRPVSYNWIDANRGTQKEIGLIAQEVQKIIPEVIGNNSDGTLSLDYPKLVAVLINSMQHQQKQISDQQELINRLVVKVGGI